MDTPNSGKVFQYWHCYGSEDPFDLDVLLLQIPLMMTDAVDSLPQ